MTLAQLSYLVALDTHRHFRKAAAACRVAQPSLSAQIRKLEDELGVVLFDRDRKPLVPTSIGEQVIDRARLVLAEVEAMRDLVQRATGEMAGTLRVGVVPSVAPYLLPLVIPGFSGQYPRITLVFETGPEDQVLALLQRGELDAGLVAAAPAARGLTDQVLFVEPLVGYVSAGHRLAARPALTVGDVVLDDLWLSGEGDGLREQVVHLGRADDGGIPAYRPIEVRGEHLETLKRLVEQGEGMTLLPWLAVHGGAPVQQALVKPFAAPVPTRIVRMVYTRTFPKKHLADVLAAEITAAVRSVLPAA